MEVVVGGGDELDAVDDYDEVEEKMKTIRGYISAGGREGSGGEGTCSVVDDRRKSTCWKRDEVGSETGMREKK